ncbi:MAG TPA: hypothetical protein VKT78_00505 [Fimbriimonadaceae bacterium]|nr:hypothetical protein [Fimbriimonadaceae bacterium]
MAPPNLPNLILIDGLPGSGKSTTGLRLVERLHSLGVEATGYGETDADHPLHVVPPQPDSAAWEDIHLRMGPEEFYAKSLGNWRTFLAGLGSKTAVLESYPFQSAARVLLQMDASPALLDAFMTEWAAGVAGIPTMLIYFEEADTDGLCRAAMAHRGSEWSRMMIEAFAQMPYAANRGLSGESAVFRLIRDYAVWMDSAAARGLVTTHRFPARPADYEARQAAVERALGVR